MTIETKENLQDWRTTDFENITDEQKAEIKVTLTLAELEEFVVSAGCRQIPNSRFDPQGYIDEIAKDVASETISDILIEESLRPIFDVTK